MSVASPTVISEHFRFESAAGLNGSGRIEWDPIGYGRLARRSPPVHGFGVFGAFFGIRTDFDRTWTDLERIWTDFERESDGQSVPTRFLNIPSAKFAGPT